MFPQDRPTIKWSSSAERLSLLFRVSFYLFTFGSAVRKDAKAKGVTLFVDV